MMKQSGSRKQNVENNNQPHGLIQTIYQKDVVDFNLSRENEYNFYWRNVNKTSEKVLPREEFIINRV